MGAGAGSLNIWVSRQIVVRGLAAVPTGTDGQAPSGASFWDVGALSAAIYENAGIRLLSGIDLLSVWVNPALLRIGNLNLVGLFNPLGWLPANRLIWGNEVSSWTSADRIVWGSAISDSHGNPVIWGTSERDQIIWGTSENDQIIWGTTMASPDAR
jgi:hypothetical protein